MDGTETGGERQPEAGGERLTALSDGVFAIAMTLLVLDVGIPPGLDTDGFHAAVRDTLPNLGAYALSFFVLAQFWRDHRDVLARAGAGTPGGPSFGSGLTHLTLLGLALIALLPFPTALLAEYGTRPLAVAPYASCLAAINALHLTMLWIRPGGGRQGRDLSERVLMADVGAAAVIFALSVPVAFLAPVAGMLVWIALIPTKVATELLQKRAAGATAAG